MQIGGDMMKNGANNLKPSVIGNGIADALLAQPKIDLQAAMMLAQAYFGEQQA
ncbi:MAG: hypothetical protein IPF58_18175 [Saprospirales bacterium]|nr:hypothetical protein [Saprospirales bacterium]